MVLLGVVALSGCLNQPGDTARIELVSSSTAKGYRLDYYRNRAYPCAVSGYQTFVVLTKLGTDPAATRPMWVKMHGGGIGYFNAAGTAVPSERWMHEESLASLMGSFDTGLMASVLGGAEEFRAVIVSMCSHDLYAGANTPDRNNPNLTPEGSPRTTNGLLATKAAVQFATGAFPTDDVFLQGGSAGSAGAIHVAWSMQLQGIAPAGVVADAGVINLGYEQGQIDQGLPCARPAEAAEVLPSRFHPDIASPANQPHLLVADVGRVDGDPQRVVPADGDHRADLDDRVEGDVALLAPLGDVDLRRRDHVDLVLDDRVGVVLRDGVLERLAPSRLRADAGLQQLAGRLAGPEAGDAHLPGDALERRIDLLLELFAVDRDRQLHLVALLGLDRCLHEAAELTGHP